LHRAGYGFRLDTMEVCSPSAGGVRVGTRA
jgi:hypothetical protein